MNSAVVTSMPCIFAFYVAQSTDTGTIATWVSQSKSSVSDKWCWSHKRNDESVWSGCSSSTDSDSTTLYGSTINSTLRVCVSAYQTGARQAWYGSTTEASSVHTVVDQLSDHDTFSIGAFFRGSGAEFFGGIDICEVHVYSGTPDDAFYTAFLGATSSGNYPENISGWIDGWILKDTASGYTSIGGTRTLTATGGVSNGVANPFTRSTGPSIPVLSHHYRQLRG